MLDIVHFSKRSETRLSESCPQLSEDSLGGDFKRAAEGASAGVAVAPAAEVFGDQGNIGLALAADAETKLVGIGNFAEEDSGFHACDADEIVDDSLAVLGDGADAIHILAGNPGPGEVAIALKVREGDTEEANLAGRVGEINISGDLAGISPAGSEMMNQREGVCSGAGVGEGPGVGEDSGVETGGHRRRNFDVSGYGDMIDHGSDGAGVFIDPVDGSEGAATGVVVNIYEGTALESEEAGAGDAVALQEDGGGGPGWVHVVGGGGVVDAVDVGEGAVGGGDGVGEDYVRLAAELVEDLGEGEDGADGVAIGTGVRGQEETGMGAEGRQKVVDLGCVRLGFEELGWWGHGLAGAPGASSAAALRFCSRFRVRARSSSMRPVIFSERSMAKVSSGTWRTPMRSRSWERM
jgi:hypothetical protein